MIIGIDEVGRGALAGPVVVVAAMIPEGFVVKNAALGILKDSKKLSAKKREMWSEYFKDQLNIHFAVARVYPRQIERRNISKAANIAAESACTRLLKVSGATGRIKIYLDGGLFLGNHSQPKNAKTIIKADETIDAVKIASIIAKVYRDRLMVRLGKKYPKYHFAVHKGYGTELHRAAIKKYGPQLPHRLTFLGYSATIKK